MDYDYYFDENCLVCLYDNNKLYYIIVERDPELVNTGLSIIKRIIKDRHKFIGDFYSVQSYFVVKYIDENSIVPDPKFSGADRNEMSLKELDDFLYVDTYQYIYVYDVKRDSITIKEPTHDELIHLDFKNREEIESFINSIK